MNILLDDIVTERKSHAGNQLLRVCHVSLTLNTGGLERLLADFARLADRSRFDLQFIAMGEVGRFADEITAYGWPVRKLRETRRIPQIRELSRILRRDGVDIVHTHNTYPHLYASPAARLAKVPVVLNTRHGQRANHGWRSRCQFRWSSVWADRIVGVSDDAARLTIEQDGVRPDKVTRIWNGIDTSAFPYRGCTDERVAISVARLSPEKDFPTLIRAADLVRQRITDFRLKIIGDGPVRSELEALVAKLDLGDTVEFLGERTDISQLLSQAGFYVSSSITEGISLTILEAMAGGLPVVATRVGGNPEIVEHETTGLMTRPSDPAALAEAMVWMCRNPQARSEMGQAGAARVAEHFDVRRMVADYQQLYADLWHAKTDAPVGADS